MKKILVISDYPVEPVFSPLMLTYNVLHGKPEDALLMFATEEPDVIFCVAEHASMKFEKAYTVYKDLKRSVGPQIRLIRLGFLPRLSDETGVYIELPVGADDLIACIELPLEGVVARFK